MWGRRAFLTMSASAVNRGEPRVLSVRKPRGNSEIAECLSTARALNVLAASESVRRYHALIAEADAEYWAEALVGDGVGGQSRSSGTSDRSDAEDSALDAFLVGRRRENGARG